MNMRRIISILDMEVIPLISTELKPAVREVTDWKNELDSLVPKSISAIVLGLFHSKIKINTVPSTINASVVNNTTLVCRIKCRLFRNIMISYHTIKPNPPKIISAATGRRTAGLLANVQRLLYSPKKPNTSNPALQKAETAIKME